MVWANLIISTHFWKSYTTTCYISSQDGQILLIWHFKQAWSFWFFIIFHLICQSLMIQSSWSTDRYLCSSVTSFETINWWDNKIGDARHYSCCHHHLTVNHIFYHFPCSQVEVARGLGSDKSASSLQHDAAILGQWVSSSGSGSRRSVQVQVKNWHIKYSTDRIHSPSSYTWQWIFLQNFCFLLSHTILCI